jgi:Reverse transcriptase (RNA-dependent DNA polymerase)/GAG-pre-integrase domain/Integrase core domain/gag-polypeptide of LTR copia-type
MSEEDKSGSGNFPPNFINEFTTELTNKFAQILLQSQKQQIISIPQVDNSIQPVAVKLDGNNYGVWSNLAEGCLSMKDKLGYVNGERSEPAATDASYSTWKAENAQVKNWLLNAMDPSLIGNYVHLTSAREIWKAIKVTYFDGGDMAHLYALKKKEYRVKQSGVTVEQYYNFLQGLWREIDSRRPNSMICSVDIEKRNQELQEDRMVVFLGGLDDKLDGVRAEIIRTSPILTIEEAYARVRREEARQSEMLGEANGGHNSMAMIAQTIGAPQIASSYITAPGSSMVFTPQHGSTQPLQINQMAPAGISHSRQHGTVDQNHNSKQTDAPGTAYYTWKQKPSSKKQNSLCTHCGKKNHTKEDCFKLNGYPDWYPEFKKRKEAEAAAKAKATLVISGKAESKQEDVGNAFMSLNSENFKKDKSWIIDSGATDHMTYCRDDISKLNQPKKGEILNANGVAYPVTGAGNVNLSSSLTLSNTLLVPSLSTKLISVGQLAEDLNCVVLMYPNCCIFQDILTGKIVGRGTKRDRLYHLEDLRIGSSNLAKGYSTSESKIWIWHRRLGHPSFEYMSKLLPNLFKNLDVSLFKCETCIKAKSHRVSYKSSFNKCDEPLDLIHSDVWGPTPVNSVGGYKWFVLFIDDCTRMTWIYLLKRKEEVAGVFKNFYTMVQNQFKKGIKFFRSDNGGEFVNGVLKDFFVNRGIIHETSCVGTPQQNGIAERKNRHILETARALLLEKNVPQKFWDCAVTAAVYVINRMPTKANDYQTPIKALSSFCTIPSILNLPPKIFGCVAYVHVPKTQRSKIESCAIKCVYLGLGSHQKGYKCYEPISRKWFVSMDVTFLENESFFVTNYTPQGEIINELNNWSNLTLVTGNNLTNSNNDFISPTEFEPSSTEPSSTEPSNPTEPSSTPSEPNPAQMGDESRDTESTEFFDTWIESSEEEHEVIQTEQVPRQPISPENDPVVSPTPPRYILPIRQNRGNPPKRYVPEDGTSKQVRYPITNYVSTEKLPEKLKQFSDKMLSLTIPNSVEEALRDPKWVKAMEEEIEALHKNNTWTLVKLPDTKKPVGCKWVYTIKFGATGNVERYKARLVAKGYTQTYGIDFEETFSPVAKLNTIRVLLSLAANLDWPLHQFDVKNAFLHGDLKEEIYMEVPPGWEHSDKEKVVCRLNKALYGLKQSPRAWFGRFCQAMMGYGFNQSDSDHTLFFKRKNGKLTLLIIYVDDMIITGDDRDEIQRLEEKLSQEFEMKNLGGLKFFLGIEVSRTKNCIHLSQRKYTLDLIAEVGMLDCKPVDTPVIQNLKLGESKDQIPVNRERYQRLVGKLIYLSHTRPDIAYAVSLVSQFMHSPNEEHMEAVIRIIRYLKGTPGKGIQFTKNENLKLTGYTDADWGGNIVDRRSTSGYFTFVGGNLVTWRSKKQGSVALSSAEAELVAVVKGICELLWLKKLMCEIGFEQGEEMDLYCDNKAAIDMCRNPIQHDRTKHIGINRHHIRDHIEKGNIRLLHVSTKEQFADILTKAVPRSVFNCTLVKLGMVDIYMPHLRGSVGAHNSGNKTMEEDMHPDGSGAACQSSQKIC